MNNASVFSLVAMLAVLGCKPSAGSQVQSLDNFAAGKRVKQNYCVGDPARHEEDVSEHL